MQIRQEEFRDYEAVYMVVKTAFETAEHTDGTEQDLVVSLRQSNAFVSELSLVATENGKIVGYILFTEIKIGADTELALAPLAVAPAYQNKGVGSRLITEGHKIAKRLGYSYSVVLGSDKYYPKFGYVPAARYGIRAPFDVEDKNFMAVQFKNKTVNGTVEYDKAFGI